MTQVHEVNHDDQVCRVSGSGEPMGQGCTTRFDKMSLFESYVCPVSNVDRVPYISYCKTIGSAIMRWCLFVYITGVSRVHVVATTL